MTGRSLPHSPEAERALLGSILLDNGALKVIAGKVTPEDIFGSHHRLILRQMINLSDNNQVFDYLTLAEELSRAGVLEKVGGATYLASLTDGIPAGDYPFVLNYARVVREKSLRRRLICVANSAMNSAFGGPETVEECLERAISELMDIGAGDQSNTDDGIDLRAASVNLLKTLSDGQPNRVLTGLRALDEATGGFLPEELIVVTSETGAGKTIFSWQIRAEACTQGKHSLYASGEMSAEHLVGRELFSTADVRHWKMRQPEELTSYDWDALCTMAAKQCPYCKVLHGNLSLSRIRWVARRANYGLVVVDYDELVQAPGATEFDQQRNLAIGLKLLAVELKIPVILVSQLRKDPPGEDRTKPSLQRLYGHSAKRKAASFVIQIDRKYVQKLEGDETEARLSVLKSRDGRLGAIPVKFNVQTLRFETPKPGGQVDT
jgi:replicative DNA helicase